jgi:hypothetical protein
VTIRAKFRDRVVIENRAEVGTETNEYGDDDITNGTEWEATETLALVVPLGSNETTPGRETRVTQFTVLVDMGVTVTGTSRVTWYRAEDDEVTGYVVTEPTIVRTLRGRDSHKQFTVEVVDD